MYFYMEHLLWPVIFGYRILIDLYYIDNDMFYVLLYKALIVACHQNHFIEMFLLMDQTNILIKSGVVIIIYPDTLTTKEVAPNNLRHTHTHTHTKRIRILPSVRS